MVHELCSTREIWGRRLVLREESEREEADKKCVVNVKFVEGRPENATNGCK